jgi:hypothetical protein
MVYTGGLLRYTPLTYLHIVTKVVFRRIVTNTLVSLHSISIGSKTSGVFGYPKHSATVSVGSVLKRRARDRRFAVPKTLLLLLLLIFWDFGLLKALCERVVQRQHERVELQQ